MADPVSGSTDTPIDVSGALSKGDPAASSTGGGWLSDIGSFLSSNTGQLITAAGTAGLGMYQAGQANKQAQAQAGQIGAAGAPAGQLYSGTLGQMQGGATVGGPTGQIISGTTGTAQRLLQTAQQYASGALTPAQQMMVNQYAAGQEAQLGASLGNRMDSSARNQGMQAIGNNATMMAQALTQQNMNLAQGALQSATQAYNSLLSSALSAGQLGLSATSDAVHTAIASDQNISQYIQQLISGIAQGLSGAGGGATGTTGLGATAGNALLNIFKGGGGSVATPQQTAYNQGIDASINQSIGQTQATTMADLTNMQMPDFNISDPTQFASTDYSIGSDWT